MADVDLDGDLDAFLAEGGEMDGEPDSLWINQGGLQGGALGSFLDQSVVRLPLLYDPSMDVDLVDIDGDGDLDAHTTNTDFGWGKVAARWTVNTGGLQGGTLGYFADETAQRWVGLAGPGSSIPTSMLVSGGGWTDSSYAAAFADLDNDGDLDLVHSSYKSSLPSRLFLNDGLGFFKEHNPAGTVTAFGQISEGSTALWCEGIYQKETADSSGSFCDVVSKATDLDLADVDGDLDIDILPSDWGAMQQRLFANRLDGSALAPKAEGLLFRDVTGLAMPPIFSVTEPVAAELGDWDEDGDLDLYGANWISSSGVFTDAILPNTGGGFFGTPQTAISSTGYDTDVVYLDFDADGDLDLLVVAITGGNRLYHNDGGSFSPPELVGMSWNYLDVGVGDTDGDGDTDLLLGRHGSEDFLRNVTDAPDQHAPWFPVLESIADRAAAPGYLPVRAHVLDNDSWMRTRFAEARIEIEVDGVPLPPSPARWAGGQVFRGEIPANLVGQVTWRYVATDEHGNTGASAWQGYAASEVGLFQAPYGTGTAGLAGGTPKLHAPSVPFAVSTFHLALSSAAVPGTPSIVVIATQALVPSVALPGLLQLNVSGAPLLVASGSLGAQGCQVLALPLGQLMPGLSVFAQGFVLDPTAGGQVLASSQGLQIVTQ